MNKLEDIKVPQENANDDFLVVSKIYKQNGESITEGEHLFDLESSKNDIEVYSKSSGFIKVLVTEGDEVAIGKIIAEVFDEIVVNNNTKKKASEEISTDDVSFNTEFSAKALVLIEENQLDKQTFSHLRFVKEADVNKVLGVNTEVKVDTEDNIKRTETLSASKRREIKYLSHVQSSNLISNVSMELDVSHLDDYCKDSHQFFKFSITPTLLEKIAQRLSEFPEFNGFYGNDKIYYYDKVNLGYAIDGEIGLRVLTLYDCAGKKVNEIERGLVEKIQKYQQDKLANDDIQNSTFTISDLSGEGVSSFFPLVNKNQCAILGMSGIGKNQTMNLSLSFDHRIVEGKRAANFLSLLKEDIESLAPKKEKVQSEVLEAVPTQALQTEKSGIEVLKNYYPDLANGFLGLDKSYKKKSLISRQSKELIMVALSVQTQCEDCIDYHVAQAIKLKIDPREIVEAASMCVVMGGGPKMMYLSKVEKAIQKYSRL